MSGELPSGTVTFLFSDIEGSTRLLQRFGDGWGAIVGAHNRILRDAFGEAGGREVDRQGDAFFAVFARARDAVTAAVQAQREIAAAEWPDGVRLRVRMGVHTGEPSVSEEGYLGVDVVRGSRICAVARGGQVLLSETTRALLRAEQLDGLEIRDVGERPLKDFDEPERLYELVLPEASAATAGPPAPPEPPGALEVPFQGREAELARHAVEAARQLDVRSLQALGPTIERRVADTLRAVGLDEHADALVARRQRRPIRQLVLPGLALVALAVAVAVWLLVKLA